MSRPLVELRGRHVVVFQVKVLQVAHLRQLVDKVLEDIHRAAFCTKSRLLLIAHASPLTPLVPVWQLGLAILKVLFSYELVQLEVVLEEPRVQGLRHQ